MFKEGEYESRLSGKSKDISGTRVAWQPSEEFFTHTEVEIDKVKKLFKTISCLCPGLIINLDYNGEKTSYSSVNGLNDYVSDAIGDKEILKNRFNVAFAEGKYKLDLVMTYTTNYSLALVPYVNTGLTETGPHITQIKTLVTRTFNKFFRDKKWLKEKDDNLSGDDIQEGMYLVFNITAPGVSYDAQVKSRITKIDMKPFTGPLTEALEYWLAANEKEVKAIADKAMSAQKAREAAKKARESVRNKTEKKRALKFSSKLADCYSKDRTKCEIYITEGK
jgi:DNA gyrase subunit B